MKFLSRTCARLMVSLLACLCALPLHADEAADRAIVTSRALPPGALWVQGLNLNNMSRGWGDVRIGRNVLNRPLTLKGTVYPYGIGTHAFSRMTIDLKGAATRFVSMVGIDDETAGAGAAVFALLVDGREVANSGILKGNDEPKLLTADLKGARQLVMEVRPINNDTLKSYADWAGAALLLVAKPAARPQSVAPSTEAARALPPFFAAKPQPKINGPRVVGCSPQRPFLFLIPATGQGPLAYSATGLPSGLKLDARTGIISGAVEKAGTFAVQLTVSGPAGKTSRALTLECGPDKLALTPPMGWNAWNIFGDAITADIVREQADWMIKSGLAARGFQYIIIDDSWQARRAADGSLTPNARFGDMKALADYVHAKGLKLGLFSSPSAETCSGFAGSAGFEEQDAAAYARWGIDYLKYDWCVAGSNAENTAPQTLKAAYSKMRAALDKVDRDIVFSITPYGIGQAYTWAAQTGVNSWGTGTQILDRWDFIRNNGFALSDLAQFARPGRWNDAGWLMVGKFGFPNPRMSRLTVSEQTLQVSLWSLAASPLMVSCDLTQLDPNAFYRIGSALLTNTEVLDVNQDPLGQPATRVTGGAAFEVWSRPLWDGTRAVGLFNKSNSPQQINVTWKDLGLSGPQPVRDLWRQSDLGALSDGLTTDLPSHGALLLKVGIPIKR